MENKNFIVNAFCTLFGALGLKFWDIFFVTKKETKEAQQVLIDSMLTQIESLNKRQDELQSAHKEMQNEISSWKDKYYKLLGKYQQVLGKYLPNYLIDDQ